MIQFHTSHSLHRSPLVRVADYECAYPGMELSRPMVAACASLALPRCGICVVHTEGKIVRADPNHVLFFNRNQEFRIRHLACGCKDCGTEMAIDHDVLAEIIREHDPRAVDDPDRLFAFTHSPITPEICVAQRIVLKHSHAGEALETEEAAIDLVERIVAASYERCVVSTRQHRPDTNRAHADLVDNAKVWLATRYRDVLALDCIARAIATSPYHLCRIFRQQTGMTLSRYIHRLRFNEAVERLAAGEHDLTRLALHLGFSSHSHFSTAFQREFHRPPSAVRETLTRV